MSTRKLVTVRYTPPDDEQRGPPFDIVQVVEGDPPEVNELPGLGKFWDERAAWRLVNSLNEKLGYRAEEARALGRAWLAAAGGEQRG